MMNLVEATYRRVDRLEPIEILGGYLVCKPDTEITFLNPTAVVILELCDGSRRLEDLAAEVQTIFSLPTLPIADVRECVALLLSSGLIERAGWRFVAWNRNHQLGKLKDKLGYFWKFNPFLSAIRMRLLPFWIRHVSGPTEIDRGTEEVVVACVVRNGATYLRSFLEHYRSLGIKKFVFLVNNSSDDTLKRLIAEKCVTVIEANAPYSTYENIMKKYIVETYCFGSWCLFADIDELFEFPKSSVLSLDLFIRYLNVNDYNAVVTQMLDMFCDANLSMITSSADDNLRSKYTFYDISSIRKSTYDTKRFSVTPQKGIYMHWGGIRHKFFGSANGLTKVSLFRVEKGIEPFFDWHHVKNAKLADVSCVLLHYPFDESFYKKVKEAVETKRYGTLTNEEYSSYFKVLERDRNLNLYTGEARKLKCIDQLIHEEFIVVSNRYLSWTDVFGNPSESQI